MRIKFIECLSGPDGVQMPGQEVEWNDAEAERLIAAGIAEACTPARQKKVETAKKNTAVETATK
jgi:hypothetical protein